MWGFESSVPNSSEKPNMKIINFFKLFYKNDMIYENESYSTCSKA